MCRGKRSAERWCSRERSLTLTKALAKFTCSWVRAGGPGGRAGLNTPILRSAGGAQKNFELESTNFPLDCSDESGLATIEVGIILFLFTSRSSAPVSTFLTNSGRIVAKSSITVSV